MYESFFHLQSRPFAAAPVVEAYFPARSIEQARQTLIRTIDRAEGPGLVIGPAGTGKSLLLRVLADHFRNVFHFVHLSSARVSSRKDLLQSVLFELDLPYRDMDEGELRLSLLDFLRPSDFCPHGVLLLVDEAHTLPLRLLDEIRMISNMLSDGEPRVRLVLAGDTRLDERFANPKLTSFNQRIAARCYLEPLGRDETNEYIRAQLLAVGGNPDLIFTADALGAVHRATDGIPRLINQVCDHALVMARLGGTRQLDASGVEESWADLQQLPGPWDPAPSTESNNNSIVEFGSLDDIDDDEDEYLADNASDAGEGSAAEHLHLAVAEANDLETDTDTNEGNNDEALAVAGETEPPILRTVVELGKEIDEVIPVEGPDSIEFRADEQFASAHEALATIEAALAAHDNLANEQTEDPRLASFQQAVYQSGWPASSEQLIQVDVEAPVEEVSPDETADHGRVEDPFGDGFDQEEPVVDRYAALDVAEHQGEMRFYHEESDGESEDAETLQAPPEDVAVAEFPTSPELPTGNDAPLPVLEESASILEISEQQRPTSVDQAMTMFECAGFDHDSGLSMQFDTHDESAYQGDSLDVVYGGEAPTEALDAAPDEAGAENENDGDGQSVDSLQAHTIRLPGRDGDHADDRDMIVVDDAGDEASANAEGHANTAVSESVRRMDYHQLFAQLRQS